MVRGSGAAQPWRWGYDTLSADIFAAVADPTRRHVFQTLAQAGPMTATALAADMDISRQAVAKHLGVLASAGMADSTKVGRETRYEAHVGPLADLQRWIDDIEGQWVARLATLAASVERQQG